MSTIRSVINAPIRIIKKIASYPLRAGLATLALDQASKIAVRNTMDLGEKHTFLNDQLGLLHVINKGAALGQSLNFDTTAKVLFAATTVSLAGLFVKAKSKVAKLGIALWASGSISNHIDRFLFGGVTDFIKTSDHWYIWNIADAAQVVAAPILLYDCLSGPSDNTAEKIGFRQILKNSFTKNIGNTLGQTLLYSLLLWNLSGYIGFIPTVIPALFFSLARDFRHNGERMF